MDLKKEYKISITSTLKCYKLLVLHIDELKMRLGEISKNDGVGAVDYDGDGIKTNNINKLVENTALKNLEDIEDVTKELDIAQSKLARLDSAIGSLDIYERQVVILGYIKGYQWIEVASEMNYSDRMIRNLRKAAVEKLAYVFYGNRAFREDTMSIG